MKITITLLDNISRIKIAARVREILNDGILKNNEYTKRCIRGLLDTDGSVCPITGRNYPYIWFTSRISKLRDDFDQGMKNLDIRTSKWNMKKNGSPEIFIGAKDQIAKYLNEISFKNEKHLGKLKLP